MDVARWVRPAIEHAQDGLSGGLGQEWEYDFMLFLGEVLLLDNLLCRVYVGLSYVTLVVSFFQKSNCFWYGFVFRLFFVLFFLS